MSPQINAPKIRVKEAAARLYRAPHTVKKWVRSGKLSCYGMGPHHHSARTAGVTQSQNVLGVDNQSAGLARQQQQQGLAGLSGLYNDARQTGLGYLNTAEQANQNQYGKQLLTGALGAAGSVGSGWAGGGFKTGVGAGR